MRAYPILIALIAIAACKPSTVFGPDRSNDELQGGNSADNGIEVPAPPARTYPSGDWDDGFGNSWRVRVRGDTLVAELDDGPTAQLIMLGTIQYETLSYQIGFADSAPMAQGQARLVDAGHALFETYNADGSLNAHGLLHFDHPSYVPTGQPVDLRPQGDRPGTEIKGD